MNKNIFPVIAIGFALCCTAYTADRLFSPSAEAFNQVNPDTELDRMDAVKVSLSAGTMTWRDRSWPVIGSIHTPQGRFRLGDARSGAEFRISESQYFIPFRAVTIAQMDRANPNYKAAKDAGVQGAVFGVHKNNLQPGTIGAGCLLVSEDDLLEISQVLPGATIVILP